MCCFAILIFFDILRGPKSKFCKFLHLWPFHQNVQGHNWQKHQNIKKAKINFFNILLATRMSILSFLSWFLKESIDFFSLKIRSKNSNILQTLIKIDNFEGSKKSCKIKILKNFKNCCVIFISPQYLSAKPNLSPLDR